MCSYVDLVRETLSFDPYSNLKKATESEIVARNPYGGERGRGGKYRSRIAIVLQEMQRDDYHVDSRIWANTFRSKKNKIVDEIGMDDWRKFYDRVYLYNDADDISWRAFAEPVMAATMRIKELREQGIPLTVDDLVNSAHERILEMRAGFVARGGSYASGG